jgi:nitrogen fixation protein NifX
MRIAFTSSDGRMVDQHFGQAREYCVWDVGPERSEFLTKVSPLVVAGALASLDEEDRTTARANAVAGCAIVCTVQIGGPAAAKLVARRIHPMKTGADVPIADVISRLQEVLRGAPPPWLRKAMNGGAKPAPADE